MASQRRRAALGQAACPASARPHGILAGRRLPDRLSQVSCEVAAGAAGAAGPLPDRNSPIAKAQQQNLSVAELEAWQGSKGLAGCSDVNSMVCQACAPSLSLSSDFDSPALQTSAAETSFAESMELARKRRHAKNKTS